ncbi:winged helix-turn-helix domain-containing protein [Nitrosopumilus sp.]|uniref:winged helix-turn-helix domain-containing protein n=1 Tax=Nitrosopumilus sp. TaxID=2024843 RepID=UPI002618A84E|nr:winged helix-turn-helix domain-containing protein [Nitrosopumilus sp.]
MIRIKFNQTSYFYGKFGHAVVFISINNQLVFRYYVGLSFSNLSGLRVFPPISIKNKTLEFFEFLKYETKSFRNETIVSKEELLDAITLSSKIKQVSKIKKSELVKQFEDFLKELDRSLFVKNSKTEISDIKWKQIDIFCNLLRLIERSDERKVRWALYYLFAANNLKIPTVTLTKLLKDFKIKNLEKIITKIIKTETLSGLDARYDGIHFVINHDKNDKLVPHYLSDAIDEPSRRSPGELEEEILKLIDEGSYSNQEISQALQIDEGLVSRTIAKLREEDKIILSSFGQRGSRYFTTNCENCPFGTTKASCRKEAISYIAEAFMHDFGLDLSANDFDPVETNQAILKIKRIVMMSRKEKNTKLEINLSENLEKLLSKVVDKFTEIETPDKKISLSEIKMNVPADMSKLPLLYQLGLKKGAQGGIHLMDEMLQLASKSIKKDDRLKIKKHALTESNKFLKNIGLDKKNSN